MCCSELDANFSNVRNGQQRILPGTTSALLKSTTVPVTLRPPASCACSAFSNASILKPETNMGFAVGSSYKKDLVDGILDGRPSRPIFGCMHRTTSDLVGAGGVIFGGKIVDVPNPRSCVQSSRHACLCESCFDRLPRDAWSLAMKVVGSCSRSAPVLHRIR